MHHQSCQHEAEDGSNMNDAAVAFVVWIDGHLIFQKFVGKDALELALGERFVTLEMVAKSSRKGGRP